MDKRTKLGIGGAAAVVAIGAGSFLGIAAATGGDDQPLQGDAKTRAVAAALASTGGGPVPETETGDDGAAYDVEVRSSAARSTTTARAVWTTTSRTSPAGAGVGESARADHLRHGPQEPGPRLDRLGHRLRRAEGAARAG